MPRAASNHFQRSAIGIAVTVMITIASPNHQRSVFLSTSIVSSRSTFQTR
jgi:hypothetical protein